MVLNMADLGWCWESFQTPWNALYVRANGFPTTFEIVPEDLGWIPKGPKSTDFDQKPWAIAHGFEHGRFGLVLGIVPNSLKCPLCACKWISNYFRDCSWRFGVNSEGSEIHRFWPKSLGYSPWLWTGSILVGAGNRSKLPEMSAMCWQMDFQILARLFLKIWSEFRRVRNPPILTKKPGLKPMVLNMVDLGKCWESFKTLWNAPCELVNVFASAFGIVPEDLEWIPKGAKSTDFDQKPWAIAHGFEHGRFREVLGIVPNSLKGLLLVFKCICKYFRDCSWRFGVNSEGSHIDRFWAKCLCYSLWFWTGPIWEGAGNHSKLSEMSPMCVQMYLEVLSGLFLKIWGEFRRFRNPPILTKNPVL